MDAVGIRPLLLLPSFLVPFPVGALAGGPSCAGSPRKRPEEGLVCKEDGGQNFLTAVNLEEMGAEKRNLASCLFFKKDFSRVLKH